MDTLQRKPEGLLDRIIKARQGGTDEVPKSATVDEVAELLAHDGAGRVVEGRKAAALAALWDWHRQGDLTFKDTGLTRVEGGRTFTRGVAIPRERAAIYAVEAADLLEVKDWCQREGLWPDMADRWCHPVTASMSAQAPTEQEAEWVTQADAFKRLDDLGLVPDDATSDSYFKNASTSKWMSPALHPDRQIKNDKRVNLLELVRIATERRGGPAVEDVAQADAAPSKLHRIAC